MLVIGEQGKVEADVRAGYVVINGEIKGTIRAEDKVEIHSRGRVCGSIITPKLIVDEGAYLEANCQAENKRRRQPWKQTRPRREHHLEAGCGSHPGPIPIQPVPGQLSL